MIAKADASEQAQTEVARRGNKGGGSRASTEPFKTRAQLGRIFEPPALDAKSRGEGTVQPVRSRNPLLQAKGSAAESRYGR